MSEGKLPEGWVKSELDNILLTIIGGGTPSKAIPEYYQGDIPWMSVKDMNKHTLTDTIDHITHDAVENSSTNIIPAGTPIIATRMSLGKIVTASFDSAINQDLKALFLSSGVDRNFFIHWYRSQAQLIESLGTGTTVKGIRLEVLRALSINLPPFFEQKIIAEKLDTLLAQVDSTKARLKQIPQILKRFRQTVLGAAVSGKIINQDYTQKSLALGSFVSIDIGNAFKSSEFSEDGIPLLRGQNIEPGSLRWDETKKFPLEKLQRFSHLFIKENDIILAMDRPIISTGLKLAKAKRNDIPCVLVQRVARFKEFKNLLPDYLYLLLKDLAFINYIQPNQTGSDIPHISGKQILNFNCHIPPLPEQHEIVRRVEQLFAYADTIEKQVNNALACVNNLTQSILAKAFRGELTAQWRAENPDLIRGENSAAALLEKIKAERAASSGKKAARKKA